LAIVQRWDFFISSQRSIPVAYKYLFGVKNYESLPLSLEYRQTGSFS
jgi:hypothetical protein